MVDISKWDIVKKFIDIVQAIVLIVGIPVAIQQLSEMQKQTQLQYLAVKNSTTASSADFLLRLEDKVDGSKYEAIAGAIQNHNSNFPILSDFGKKLGKFKSADLEEYLGHYDTIGLFLDDNIIPSKMLYNEFSFEVEKIYCNKDIYSYVSHIRTLDKNSTGTAAFFGNMDKLAITFFSIDHENCEKLDLES